MARYLPDLINFRVVSVREDEATSLSVGSARAVAAEFRADDERHPGVGFDRAAGELDAACSRVEDEARRWPSLASSCGLILAEAA